jgi:hypothetical protein
MSGWARDSGGDIPLDLAFARLSEYPFFGSLGYPFFCKCI